MTQLEEAVARIIEEEFAHTMDGTSLARRILALPEIVKIQEALKPFSEVLDFPHLSGVEMDGWQPFLTLSYVRVPITTTDLRRAREALATLQPLKKEAE